MVDLVHAIFYSLNGIHAERDVSGYGHAQPMRFSRNNFQDVRFHRTIYFDLLEAGSFVFLYLLSRLLWRVYADHSQRKWPRAIDYACHDQPRTEAVASGYGITRRNNKFSLVANVARRGNARREVNRPPLHLLKMRALRHWYAGSRSCGDDLPSAQDNYGILNRRFARAVD